MRRPSWLTLLIVLDVVALVGAAVAFVGLGHEGCRDRGDCTAADNLMLVVVTISLLALPVLLLGALMRWAIRRLAPRPRRRMRLRDRVLAYAGGVTVLIGVLGLIFGLGSGRIAGAVVLLFGLTLLAVPLAGVLPKGAGAPELGRVRHGGTLWPALVLPAVAWRVRMLQCGIALFAATGLLMALYPEALADRPGEAGEIRFGGIACVVVFGGVFVIGLFTGRGRLRLALLEPGLRWEAGSAAAFVPWEALGDVWIHEVQGTRMLAFDVQDPSAVVLSRAHRLLSGLNRRLSGADHVIPLETFTVDPWRLADAIEAYAAEPSLRRELGTRGSVERLSESELAAAEPDDVPGPHLRFHDRAAVDPRPVARTEVAQEPAAVREPQLGVPARDGVVAEDEMAAARAAEHQPSAGELRRQREQP
jgi:hypothetical protein